MTFTISKGTVVQISHIYCSKTFPFEKNNKFSNRTTFSLVMIPQKLFLNFAVSKAPNKSHHFCPLAAIAETSKFSVNEVRNTACQLSNYSVLLVHL